MTHIANDWSPPPIRELSALEVTFRATTWAHDRFAERCRLDKAQREERARRYEERAVSYAQQAQECPSLLELAGFNALAARIMRSE